MARGPAERPTAPRHEEQHEIRAQGAPVRRNEQPDAGRGMAAPVGSAGVDGNELVLSVPRRDEDEPAHRSVAGVPDGVGHPPRHED